MIYVGNHTKQQFREVPTVIGAAGGYRTHDPWLRRPILYPLRYSRMLSCCFILAARLASTWHVGFSPG